MPLPVPRTSFRARAVIFIVKPECVALSFSGVRREKMILIGGESGQTDWRAPYQAGVIFGICTKDLGRHTATAGGFPDRRGRGQ